MRLGISEGTLEPAQPLSLDRLGVEDRDHGFHNGALGFGPDLLLKLLLVLVLDLSQVLDELALLQLLERGFLLKSLKVSLKASRGEGLSHLAKFLEWAFPLV